MSPSTIHSVRHIYRIASIPADGIGPEVIGAGIEVLTKLAQVLGEFEFHFEHFDWGSDVYKKTGKYIPDGGLESLKKYNAILFGAVGDQGNPNLDLNSHRCDLADSLQRSQITSLCGAYGWASVNPFNNSPIYGLLASFEVHLHPFAIAHLVAWTGSSFARIPKASMRVKEGAHMRARLGK